MNVIGANGRVFGTVDDVELDAATWRATSLVARVRSDAITDLGLEKPFWSRARLSIPIHHVSGATNVVVLKTTLEEFAQLIAHAAADPD
ncbi:MAG: hypothetical protein H0T42_33570 [Deltaproteobacteria bacterium]|nr:hypothetical protein [Deltaproteobacteria bacterium]